MLIDHDVEATWNTLRNVVYNTAFECLGPITRKYKDWFDKNCAEIAHFQEDKHRSYKTHIDDPTSNAKKGALRNVRSRLQRKIRDMQGSLINTKADEIKRYADSHDINNFYYGLKNVKGPTPLAQHFSSVLTG